MARQHIDFTALYILRCRAQPALLIYSNMIYTIM